MSVRKDKIERKKSLAYSEDFRAMLERLEEEDNAEKGQQLMKKNRLCVETVKALEKHFEEENKLQPERKLKIAEEVGLEPRQVAIWFQNRRARWRTKQLEREYDGLRASYDALKHDYGSLEQEKLALLAQLKDLKAKIEARNSIKSIPIMEDSNNMNVIMDENNSVNAPLSSASMDPSPCSTTTYDPFSMAPSTSMPLLMDAFQLYRAYQDQLLKIEELGVHTNNNINNELSSGNFFSVDQAPTLNCWYNNDQFF